MLVVPRASTAAMIAFSVPVTDASSRYRSPPTSPRGARRWYSRSTSTSAPSAANAIRWVSTRRRPITSPPGGGTSAEPKRASSGPASRIDARMRVHSSGSSVVEVMSAAHTRKVLSSSHSTSAPMSTKSSIIASTSRIRGTFSSVTGSAVSRHAARIGSAAFLFPAGRTRPESGTPPSITNVSTVPSRVAIAISGRASNVVRGEGSRIRAHPRWFLPLRWYTRSP